MAPVLGQGATLHLGGHRRDFALAGACFHTIIVSARCYSSILFFFFPCGLNPAFNEREGNASRLRCFGSRERSEAQLFKTGTHTNDIVRVTELDDAFLQLALTHGCRTSSGDNGSVGELLINSSEQCTESQQTPVMPGYIETNTAIGDLCRFRSRTDNTGYGVEAAIPKPASRTLCVPPTGHTAAQTCRPGKKKFRKFPRITQASRVKPPRAPCRPAFLRPFLVSFHLSSPNWLSQAFVLQALPRLVSPPACRGAALSETMGWVRSVGLIRSVQDG
ncbi:hypothetical protein BDP55DRAFT_632863 [Colletotrichum godetiae]|uniref:Uncharacterized protein n=1 Tax=Colletotrichum godetiae TaxID=1209918 RepID=A0AAJ0EX15_9PEZI|nr:uncharacterized protein BDP55DRAFT_632863 [Colletotrichum godetiae]KAK1674800.1 hypothetical protein BDP55DRAFT_632863 [Colletotrichum godetiae]